MTETPVVFHPLLARQTKNKAGFDLQCGAGCGNLVTHVWDCATYYVA